MAERLERFPVAESCGSDWAFVPIPSAVPNQTLTGPLMSGDGCRPGSIGYDPLAGAAANQNFKAVLFGDCTGSSE